MSVVVGMDRALVYRIAESEIFARFIMGVIIVAGIVVGLETSPDIVDRYWHVLIAMDVLILAIFGVELGIKIWTGFHYGEDNERQVLWEHEEEDRTWLQTRWRRAKRFFREPWNIFDFLIVVASLIPFFGTGTLYLRLARLFRILRLVRIIPTLPQAHVATIWSARKAFAYILFLLGLLFYMYSVAGVFLFNENDPVHFGTLKASFLTLFRVVTLEGWTNIMYTQMYGCDVYGFGAMEHLCTSPREFPLIAPLYFVSFILMGTIIFLNMFVGIIVTAMDDATRAARQEEMREVLRKMLAELQSPDASRIDLEQEIFDLDAQLAIVEERLHAIRQVTSQMRQNYGANTGEKPPDEGK